MATLAGAQTARLSFWAKMTIGISVFIIFGFAQFGLRGMVDYAHAPLVMHLHGIAMLAWLSLLMTQAVLAGRGGLALHRKLGWASAGMLPLIVVLASMTCLAALPINMFPPFFTAAYFLALVHVSVVIFAVVVATAVSRRGQPDWHKRLMVGSTILLMEPALGRVLPMPFIMPWGEWLSMAIQLGVAALIVRHDRKELGAIHPATVVVGISVVLSHVVVEVLAVTPAWIAFTARMIAA
ncbi:hypothetical protein [Novosphingobium album (ex Hu et al. 2023)]|uniref:Adenylate cyclase n=1 Tax=Novosphingobium album (ex Hu et al. 2023) TaxID=2930093 RepID=A0ABT0AZG9_9SPHN|nr:hypothetical protein [Novosphingobium album (ex Hu et al. 2023)]MCJ2178207.1 hypothetical protein [Novosphingobium album (ex Hu et al. 2023)]